MTKKKWECYTCGMPLSEPLNYQSGRVYCGAICRDFFKPFRKRVRREFVDLGKNFGQGVTTIDPEVKERWAFVRVNKAMARGLITQEDYNDILHHISNGHTFMAYVSLRNRQGGKK